ncbi:hypothetical protein ACCQ14_08235 [Xanthomonas sp. NCPPB 2865]|uniref:hypothetical protein n=1 Tax=unclassified Xanthomonas TaxID=2643310 RepID=UPI003558F919
MSQTLHQCALASFFYALFFSIEQLLSAGNFRTRINLTRCFSVIDSKTESLEKRMTATSHYHDRIARATKQLAQLQAKELLANQRTELKAKQTARREKAKRRQNVADLVFSVDAHVLDDDELAGALLQHLDARKEPSVRQAARLRGAARAALPST